MSERMTWSYLQWDRERRRRRALRRFVLQVAALGGLLASIVTILAGRHP